MIVLVSSVETCGMLTSPYRFDIVKIIYKNLNALPDQLSMRCMAYI
jgi:hypothetical protein